MPRVTPWCDIDMGEGEGHAVGLNRIIVMKAGGEQYTGSDLCADVGGSSE